MQVFFLKKNESEKKSVLQNLSAAGCQILKKQNGSKMKNVGKNDVSVLELEFLVWHHAIGLTSPKEELDIIQVCSTATNMATLGTC